MTVLGGIDRRLLQNVDWPLLGAMGGLVILSATTLASLHIGRAGGNVAFRQLAWFTLGLFALVAVASVDYRRLVRLAPVFFVMGLVGLASVFVLGRTVSGARRWILLGPMSVQPSEVFKRSEEHTSELQSPYDLVCRLLLEKKNTIIFQITPTLS